MTDEKAARSAVVDLGSNAVKLLVLGGTPDAPETIVQESQVTGLARGLHKTGRLNPDGMEKTFRVLDEFVAKARELGAQAVVASATSAVRDAEGGSFFAARAADRSGIPVRILDGQEEAELSFLAVSRELDHPASLVVVDLGGGSLEVAYGEGGEIREALSRPTGSVRLTERFCPSPPASEEQILKLETEVQQELVPLLDLAIPENIPVAAVGVTPAMASAMIEQDDSFNADTDLVRMHGKFLSLNDMVGLRDEILPLPLETLLKLPGIDADRAPYFLAASTILIETARILGSEGYSVSAREHSFSLALRLLSHM